MRFSPFNYWNQTRRDLSLAPGTFGESREFWKPNRVIYASYGLSLPAVNNKAFE